MTMWNDDARGTAKMALGDAILRAVRGQRDGLRTGELAEALQADYVEVSAALRHLDMSGVVARSRVRLGSWVPTGLSSRPV
jgi:Mn-dependent DtxR family transcriptional regulator